MDSVIYFRGTPELLSPDPNTHAYEYISPGGRRYFFNEPSGKLCLLWPCLVSKIFHSKVSHRILWHMYEVLNVDEKKLIAQLGEKSQDETFESN